jgi:periplasmic protein TonB
MFGNLVESGSHRAEARRKGKYFLVTLAFYGLLLVASGVGSIYAYNVRVEDRDDYELLALMRFSNEQPAEAVKPERRAAARARAAGSPRPARATVPEIASQNPNLHGRPYARADTPDLPRRMAADIGPFKDIPIGPEVTGLTNGGGPPNGSDDVDGPTVVERTPPPALTPRVTPTPAATPKQDRPLPLTSTVISGKAVEKPAPPYPTAAKMVGADGSVPVIIVVDERGRVVSAKASGGHPLLRQAAVEAAYRARFEPTRLGGQPVKVTGVITYNFVLR